MRRFTETNTGTRPKRGAKSARFWRRSTTQSIFTPLSATCLRRSSKTSSERLREYRDESDPAFFQAWRNLSADVFLLQKPGPKHRIPDEAAQTVKDAPEVLRPTHRRHEFRPAIPQRPSSTLASHRPIRAAPAVSTPRIEEICLALRTEVTPATIKS